MQWHASLFRVLLLLGVLLYPGALILVNAHYRALVRIVFLKNKILVKKA